MGPGHFRARSLHHPNITITITRGGRRSGIWGVGVGVGRSGRSREGFVEGEPDGLDGYIWGAGPFQEGAEDASRDVASAADGDHEVWREGGEDVRGGGLAKLVDLERSGSFVSFFLVRFFLSVGLGGERRLCRGGRGMQRFVCSRVGDFTWL